MSSSTNRRPDPSPSVIVRDLDGNISLWNPSAERFYGWTSEQAVGSVSHKLFDTGFPYDLKRINDDLLRMGIWEGVLEHTLRDGRRVKVQSRWELQGDGENRTVFEINRQTELLPPKLLVLPRTSPRNRTSIEGPGKVVAAPRNTRHLWWVIPLCVSLALFMWFLNLTLHIPRHGILE